MAVEHHTIFMFHTTENVENIVYGSIPFKPAWITKLLKSANEQLRLPSRSRK